MPQDRTAGPALQQRWRSASPAVPRHASLALTPDRPNPWFASGVSLLYLNSAQALFLAKPLKVDDKLAKRIAQDARMPNPVRSSGWHSGSPLPSSAS